MHFFHFLNLCSGAFFSFLFLANFEHLATKNKSSANHTKDFCKNNASMSPYFKGICFRKSSYIKQWVSANCHKIVLNQFLYFSLLPIAKFG
jgi:hypothetical protein